jgi:hypothetical protein
MLSAVTNLPMPGKPRTLELINCSAGFLQQEAPLYGNVPHKVKGRARQYMAIALPHLSVCALCLITNEQTVK